MSYNSIICKAGTGKRIISMLLVLVLLTASILSSFPVQVSAAPAWTNAWTVIGDAETGGPANPFGIAADQTGNVYITNGTEILKLANGSSSWQAINKTGLSAKPDGIALDKNGDIYVTDCENSLVQYLEKENEDKIDDENAGWLNIGGKYATRIWIPTYWSEEWGWVEGHWEDSTAYSGGINLPYGIAVDKDLNVYVANPGNINYPEYFNSLAMLHEGKWSILGNSYDTNVPCNIADVAVDTDGNVYVTTQYSSGTRVGQDSIRKLSSGTWSTIPRTYANDPVNPGGIAVDGSGHIYVVSEGDRTVKVYAEGKWTSIGGSGIGGPQYPKKIAVDGSGNIYVTDWTKKQVWKLQAPAAKLIWVEQPTDGVAGRPWSSPPKVALVDANGNVETNANNYTVTLSINSSNGAAISGASATLQNGIATFDSLTVNKAGSGYTLTPSCSLSPNLEVQNSSAFNMNAPEPPQVTGISPEKGIGGTEVTITGTNLTAASLVKFGEVAGVNLVVISDTTIKVTAPSQGAGSVSIRVTTPGGESAAYSQFTYNQPGVWTGSWTLVEGPSGGFGSPKGLAIDNDDNIYVTDNSNNKLYKLSGSSWSTTVSGLSSPRGVAVDSSGNIYVADTGNSRIMKNDSSMYSWSGKSPTGVAVDKSDNVYVVLYTTSTMVGGVYKWNGTDWSDITYDGAFEYPKDIAVDSYGNVYVVDSYLNSVKKLPNGAVNWETIGSGFSSLEGIFADTAGNVYITYNQEIKELRVGSTEWMSVGGGLGYLQDVALDSQGNMYVTSVASGSKYLYKRNAPATQLVWDTQPEGGPAGQALMPYPKLSLKDAKGRIVEGESGLTVTLSLYSDNGATLEGTETVTMVNGTADFVDLRISKPGKGYRLVPSFSLSDIAIFDSESFDVSDAAALIPPLAWAGGWTTIGSSANGFSSSSSISGITVDDDSSIYVLDRNNESIKKLNEGTWTGLEVTLPSNCYGIALHDSDIYVAGYSNYNILKNGSGFGDFKSADWGYLMPYDVAVDKSGNVYTVGSSSTTAKVLKYDGSTWSSIVYHESFSYPKGITVDDKGNVYVSDSNNKDIKMLPAGTKQWKTIGTGFNSPQGIAVDNSGNVYVADSGAIKVLTAGSSEWTAIPTDGTAGVTDVAVDISGNVYAVYNSYVYMHQAPAAKLVWETQPGGGTGNVVWDQQPVVSLRDAGDNILTGDSSSTVTVTLSPANGATLDGTANTATVTLDKGVASFSGLKVDKPGTYTLTLSSSLSNDSIECPESAPFDITAGPVDSAKSEVIAGKTEVIADNSDSAAITVTLNDECGNPVGGKTVALAQGEGSSVISPVESITDDGGNAIFWVKSTKAETVTYTAEDKTDGLTVEQTAQISFKAGSIDKAQSTVEADKEVVTADNSDSAVITVTLKDAYGNPVGGKTVTLSQQEGSSDISPSNGVSDAAGKVAFTVKNTKVETITYTAEAEGTALPGTAQVTFVAGEAEILAVSAPETQRAGESFDVTVTAKDKYGNTALGYRGTVQLSSSDAKAVLPVSHTFEASDNGTYTFSGVTLKTAGVQTVTAADAVNGSITGNTGNITVNAAEIDAAISEVAADKTNVTADGADSSSITVTLKDAYGNPISGKTVILEAESGSSVITTVSGTSGIDGTTVFTVKNTVAEQVTYTAAAEGKDLSQTVVVSFVPGPAKALTVSAAETQTAGIPFDITVTVKDEYGNTVTDYSGTVQLTSTDTKAVLPESHTYEASDKGIFKFEGIILKTAGVQAITATDTSNSSITGTKGNITVGTGGDYSEKSTVSASKSIVTADGIDSATITVTLKDEYNNLISGKIVTLSQGEGSSVVEAVCSTTRLDGTAEFTVTDTKAEQVTYTARVNGVAINQTVEVTFIPGPAESLTVSAAGTQKAGEPFSVTVTAKDRYGNTATGYRGTVLLTGTDAKAVLPEAHTYTADDKGTYTFSGVILKTAGTHSITSVDADNASINGTVENITVAAGSSYSTLSEITADKSAVTADGKDSASITVLIRDDFGNPVSGKIVTLSQSEGSSVVEAVYGTSRLDGTALFTVTGTKAETVNYMAMIDGKAVTGAVEVTFVPGPAARLEWKIQPGGGAAGQIWPQQPVLVLKDLYGNVNTDDNSSEVTLELKNSKGATLGGTKTVTLKNGEAVFSDLSVNKRGSYILRPVINIAGIDSHDSNTFRISLVPAPGIEPNGGTFTGPVTVSIDYPEEFEAYYNLNGDAPTEDSIFYDGPFSIFSNSTVTAAVYDSVYGEWSSITRADFVIRLEMPTATPPDGSTVQNNSTVTLSNSMKGAVIYYTTDGSMPNTGSQSGNTVQISGAPGSTVTLKAYAVKSGYGDSDVASFRYTIQSQPGRNDNDSKDTSPSTGGGNRTVSENTPLQGAAVVTGGKITVSPKLDGSTGKASAVISSELLAGALSGVQAGPEGVKTVELSISMVQGANTYEPTLPASYLSTSTEDTAIRIMTDIATVTVPGNMLPSEAAAEAQNVSLTIAAVDRTALPADIQAQIGNKPIVELNLSIDGRRTAWVNEEAPVTVSLPYTPTAEELMDPEHITVWYIDGSGNVIAVPSGRYDPVTGTVTFTTTHFSSYAVVYVKKTFTDIGSYSWAKKQIEVLASKGIIETKEKAYSPGAGITRADYLVMLVRALGVTADFESNFDDVKPGDYYYKEIGISRKLGITSGIGNNKFDPFSEISRQDMMTMTERALRKLGKLSVTGMEVDLDRFTDKESIAAYAVGSMASLVKAGLIKGSGSRINPLSDTTRAEAAVFIYRIYNMK